MKTLMQQMEEIAQIADNMVKSASELNEITSNIVNGFGKEEEINQQEND